MRRTILAALAGTLLVTAPAVAGTVWVSGVDMETYAGKVLGFDDTNGELTHNVDGGYISAIDVCPATGTAFYLDDTTLKSVDANGNAKVIAEYSSDVYVGMPQVKVGPVECTVWVYAIGGTDIHIVRNPGEARQETRDTYSFSIIESADVDDVNDDLWIGQINGKVHRVSKKTGLRSYRIGPTGDSYRSIAVKSGIVHILGHSALRGYRNTTRIETPQQLYTDTSFKDLFDGNARINSAAVHANSAGDPVVTAYNYFGPGDSHSDVLRMEVNAESKSLSWTNDRFVPFEDVGTIARWDSEAAEDGNMWHYDDSRIRLFAPNGAQLREIDFNDAVPDFYAYDMAY